MKNFKEMRIWQEGIEIAKKCYQLVASFPKSELYNLSSQITRCAVSISSNIAEGNSRLSDKDKARFIEIALGSAFELQTHLIIAREIGIGNPELLKEILDDVEREQKMIATFLSLLRKP